MVHTVRVIDREREWDALEDEWNAVLDRSASRSVFLTWEWLRAWWRHYGGLVAAGRLQLLVARDESGIAGIAPLYWDEGPAYGLGRIRRLRLVGDGTGDSEYQDLIIRSGCEADVVPALLASLHRLPWDVVELGSVPASSPNRHWLEEAARHYGYRYSTDDSTCVSAVLPHSWDEYLKGLDPRFRTRLRSLLRRLPAERAAIFERCDDPDALGAELEAMFRLHQDRWRAAGAPGSFGQPERRAFYGEIARTFLERDWLRFFTLRVDGSPAAYEFSFEYGGRVFFLQQAYDAALAPLSVGTALKAFVLRDCIERGVREYDFLADAAAYKLKWGVELRTCTRLTLARPGLRVGWSLGVPRLAGRVRRGLRSATPAALLRFRQRLRRALSEAT
jgi:hypothetical protein